MSVLCSCSYCEDHASSTLVDPLVRDTFTDGTEQALGKKLHSWTHRMKWSWSDKYSEAAEVISRGLHMPVFVHPAATSR